MTNKFLRVGALTLPLLAAAVAVFAACTDDENGSTNTDAGADVMLIDGGVSDATTGVDANRPDAGGNMEAGPLPALCLTYTDTVIPGDASVNPDDDPNPFEPADFKRYRLIALRALYTGVPSADKGALICSIAQSDPDFTPIPLDCLQRQLMAVAGCVETGIGPVNYDTAADENAISCVDAGAAGGLQLGFHVPSLGANYTAADINYMLELIRIAAIRTGFSTADADRLKNQLMPLRSKVLDAGVDADTDAGFSSAGACNL